MRHVRQLRRTDHRHRGLRIRVELRRRAEDTLELAVEDDGIGWTGEGRPRGTGLGSRIVRAMATNLRSGLCYVPDRVGTRAVLSFRA